MAKKWGEEDCEMAIELGGKDGAWRRPTRKRVRRRAMAREKVEEEEDKEEEEDAQRK